MDVQGEDQGFGPPQAPLHQKKDNQGDDAHVEARNSDDMGHSSNDKFLLHLFRNLFPLAQDEGLHDAASFHWGALLQEDSDPFPPRLDELKKGVSLSACYGGNPRILSHISGDPDPLACQKPSVVKSPGVIEISRMIEFGYEADSVSIPEISPVFLDGDENITPGFDQSIGKVYFLDLQVELCPPRRWDGPPIEEALQIYLSLTGVMEDMVRREVRAKVEADEHHPQEPEQDEDGNCRKRWPFSEDRADGYKDQGGDAEI